MSYLAIFGLSVALAACGSNTEQRSASGAGSGVVAGALVGGPVGALVGAAAGGAGGAALDEGVDKKTEDAIDKAKRDDRASGSSGSSTASAAAKRPDADAIRDGLRKDGYTNVGSFRREGDIYKATATRDGKRYDLTIDANTGKVRDTRAI
jgi:hypothetical protein